MPGQIENRQIIVSIVADDVQKAQESLLKKQKALNDEIKKTNDPKALKEYKQQLDQVTTALNRNEKVLKGELLPTYNQLTAAVRKYYAEFKKTGDPAVLKKYTEANALLKQQKAEIAALEKQASGLTKTSFFQASFWGNLAAQGVARLSSAIGSFFRGAVDEALQADEATARLGSTLDNLGRSDAFDRITRKADEMAKRFRYLDNDDVIGVFEKLIDYGKLTEKEMNELLPVIIDFAAKTRTSLADATSVIIKALEGNGKALKEFGINIKDTGNETDRLNVVMTTLKEKTDGAADAFQNSAKGGIATARQEFKNLQEDIGNLVIPALNSLLSFVVGAAKGLKQFAKDIRNVFTGGSSKAAIDSEVSNQVATDNVNDFIDKIKNKSLKDRIALIKKEIEFNEFSIEQENKALLQAKFDGQATDERKKKNKELNEVYNTRIKLLKDQLTLEEGTPLGIIDKAIGGSKPVKNKTKEVEEMAASVKNLGDVIEKELRRRNADIAAGGQGIGIGIDFENGLNNGIARARQGANRNAIAALELQVLKTRAKRRLDAELALLKEQQRQELENKELTENEKLLIEEKYRQKRKDAEQSYFQEVVNEIVKYARIVTDLISTINDIQDQKENAALARDKRINDQKIKNLDNRLKRGLISQKEYDRQVAEIEKKQQQREQEIAIKQFRRQQRLRVVESIINTAEAVTEALPNFILAAAVGIAGAAKTALIATQKPPQFARGSGPLGGRTHSQGGNPIMDGSGNKIAEIEAGEAIINRRSMADRRQYTLSGTPSQIASHINGLHGGVQWERPRYLNYGAINSRYYAQGGQFEATTGQQPDTTELTAAVKTLNYILQNQGIQVSVSRVNTAQDRLAAIKAEATIK